MSRYQAGLLVPYLQRATSLRTAYWQLTFQTGLLVPALTGAEMKQRIALAQEEARAHKLAAEVRRQVRSTK